MSYDVVIPVDGSEMSERAVAFAAHLPLRTVTLLRVEPDFQILRPGPLQDFREDWRDIQTEEVVGELTALGERFPAGEVEVALVVRFGDPATEIIESAEDADLIVMTTHGREGAGRMFFGSVADRVVRQGTVPTLVIRDGQYPVTGEAISRLVVPLDGSEAAEVALPEAARLAQALGVPVRLVHVVDLAARGAPSPFAARDVRGARGDDGAQADRAVSYLQRQAARLAASGVKVGTEVHIGGAVTVLLDLLQANDLLVMTTLGLGGLQRWWLGSVAEKLIREAICPVLVIRKDTANRTPALAAVGREAEDAASSS